MTIQGREWVIIATPLYDDAAIRGAVAVVRDMTQERRLNKLREDFITNITHELRTPISLLQGYSEAIIDDIADTVEAKNELAQIIHDESLRIGRLVNQSSSKSCSDGSRRYKSCGGRSRNKSIPGTNRP